MKRHVWILVALLVITSMSWGLLRQPNRTRSNEPQPSQQHLPEQPSRLDNAGHFDSEILRGSKQSVVPFYKYSPAAIGMGPPKSSSEESTASSGPAGTEVDPLPLPVVVTPTNTPSVTEAPATPSPSDDARDTLRELQNLGQNASGSRMPGVRNPREPESPRVIEPTPTISPTPTVTPTPTLSRVGGIPTGYTMLYLMHPKARPAVERQVEALIRANLQEIYLGALVDGTFGLDFEYLQNVIRRLAAGDHAITLVLFFSNGSAMRDYNRTAASVAFNLVPPDAFRLLIQFDEGTRLQFQQMVSRAIPAFDLNTALNSASRNIAIPMLEDNLDVTSYQSMRELMAAVLRGRADIMRNPCPGCATGNDSNSLGDGVESHNPGGLAALTLRDGFSLDGSGYELPGDAPNQQLSLDSVRDLKAFAGAASLRYFGLWRKQRQGLGTTLIDPDARTYEVPTDEQFLIEVDLLRWGLESLFPTATPTETPEE